MILRVRMRELGDVFVLHFRSSWCLRRYKFASFVLWRLWVGFIQEFA